MPVVTIQNVADYAKVSRATVSRVLNQNPKVDVVIRDRVLEAVRTLGYQPNRAARRLRKQASDVIGVIISDIQNPYFTSVIRGIEDTAYKHQMNIVLCNSDEDSTKLEKYLRVMQAESVAGLIIVPTDNAQDGAALENFRQNGIPIILLDRVVEGLNVDAVQVDNLQGAYTAVRHLIDLRRRRIGIIYPDIPTGHKRCEGYLQALREAGLPEIPILMKMADYSAERAYRLAGELTELANPPDAIFTATDLMTLGTLRALREHGVRVPEVVALVGFDDMPWAEELYSPLTVIAQPTYQLGQETVRLLLERLDNLDAPFQTVTMKTQLIVRESCGVRLRQG